MTHHSISKIAAICVLPGAVVFAAFALTGCETETRTTVSYHEGPGYVYVEDDYVYYPQYQVYYSNRRHEYGYRDGSSWVWRPSPPRVGINILVSSPSVHLDFHDSPERHHAEVVRTYPSSWRQSETRVETNVHRDVRQPERRVETNVQREVKPPERRVETNVQREDRKDDRQDRKEDRKDDRKDRKDDRKDHKDDRKDDKKDDDGKH